MSEIEAILLTGVFSGVAIVLALEHREVISAEREFNKSAENDAMMLAQLIIYRARAFSRI